MGFYHLKARKPWWKCKKKLDTDAQVAKYDIKIGKYAKDYFTTYFLDSNKFFDLQSISPAFLETADTIHYIKYNVFGLFPK